MPTPAKDGFRMPAEWEPHAGAWMLWPERPDNWRDEARPAQRAYAAVAAAIARGEPVTMGVSAGQFAAARAMLPAGVRVVEISSNDAWMRDVGPTFVTDRRRRIRGVDWMFNAWGGKAGGVYADWSLDDQVAAKVLEIESTPRYRAPFILEGGAIHVDGQGTLLTTEECLLNPNRNPTLRRVQVEGLLERYLGVREIIWLGRGVYNDETDGHMDNLCCFVRPASAACSSPLPRSGSRRRRSRVSSRPG
jgi:agmatine deiminase